VLYNVWYTRACDEVLVTRVVLILSTNAVLSGDDGRTVEKQVQYIFLSDRTCCWEMSSSSRVPEYRSGTQTVVLGVDEVCDVLAAV
jgi:hypothetical protein